MFVWGLWACNAHRGQERALDLLELESGKVFEFGAQHLSCECWEPNSDTLQMHHCSLLLSHLSSPNEEQLYNGQKTVIFHILERWLHSHYRLYYFCECETTETVPSYLTLCFFLAWNCSVLFFTDLISKDKAGSMGRFCAAFPVFCSAFSTA